MLNSDGLDDNRGGFIDVPRTQDYREVRAEASNFPSEIEPGYFRHRKIAEDEIKIMGLRAQRGQSFTAGCEGGHDVARPLQDNRAHSHHRSFVVDEQNAFAVRGWSETRGTCAGRDFRTDMFREIQAKRRAHIQFTAHKDRPVVAAYDAVHDGESEAAAFVRGFRCEERFENPTDRLLVHATPCVGDRQPEIRSDFQLRVALDEFSIEHELIDGEFACDYTFAFSSVIGFGKVEFISVYEEKVEALKLLMKHQSKREDFHFSPREIDGITLYKITTKDYSAKRKAGQPLL